MRRRLRTGPAAALALPLAVLPALHPLARAVPVRRLLVPALALAALGAAFLALRDLPVFAVERVAVRGVTGPDAPAITAALSARARGMTTLHVDAGELDAAVRRWPTVAGIEVDRQLPNGVTLRIREDPPVAVAGVTGWAIPVAADGRFLRGATAPSNVPVLGGRARPRLVALLAAAPAPLLRRARRAYLGPEGLTIALRQGPTLRFGRGTLLGAKWSAAARVLADPASAGARSIDLSVPERPAAAGVVPSTEASGSSGAGYPPAQVEVEG